MGAKSRTIRVMQTIEATGTVVIAKFRGADRPAAG